MTRLVGRRDLAVRSFKDASFFARLRRIRNV
jgi:hypothetical protein